MSSITRSKICSYSTCIKALVSSVGAGGLGSGNDSQFGRQDSPVTAMLIFPLPFKDYPHRYMLP